jgi:hypothetical protein
MDPELLSKAKLTEMLELFQKNKEGVTVREVYTHCEKMYNEDKEAFSKKLTSETENLSDKLLTDEPNTSKPFGQYGEVTLNEIGVTLKEKLKDINWEYNQTRLTVHGIPVAVNAI